MAGAGEVVCLPGGRAEVVEEVTEEGEVGGEGGVVGVGVEGVVWGVDDLGRGGSAGRWSGEGMRGRGWA